jgi:chromosome partitioning protein
MPNAKVVVITNNKGGVGKSTTAEALADGLAEREYLTLLLDLDPQGSISTSSDQSLPTSYEVMTRQTDILSAIQRRDGRADILPASKFLSRLNAELIDTGKEYRLREVLAPALPGYDYIIVDTPPALGVLTVNALTAANALLIPAQADVFSLQGIGQLMETVEAIKAYTNPGLSLMGILLTRHSARSILSREMTQVAAETADKIGTFLYRSVIREAVAVKEAQAFRQSIFAYAPSSNPAIDYTGFVLEFLANDNKKAVRSA